MFETYFKTSLTQAAEPFDFWIGLKRTINNRGEASNWFWKGPGTETCPFSSGPNFYRSPDPPTGVGGGDIQRIATRLKINQLRNPNENWEAHRWDEPQATTGYVCMEKPTGKMIRLDLKSFPFSCFSYAFSRPYLLYPNHLFRILWTNT